MLRYVWLRSLTFGLMAAAAAAAINPFVFKKTASTCVLASLVDFEAKDVGEGTLLRYVVQIDEVIWDEGGLKSGDKVVIRYRKFERQKPGFWDKLFNRNPPPGPQELYEPELDFFENDQAVLFLDEATVDGETFHTPAANQYSSEPPDYAEPMREYAVERK